MVFPDKNTEVDCHLLLQGIIPSQQSNPGILHYRQVLYHLSHWESPMVGLIVHKCWARALVNKNKEFVQQLFSSVQLLSPTLYDPMDCSMPGFPVYHQLLELSQTHVHWVSDAIHHLILCHPLLLLPSIFPSIRVFSNESVLCIKRPKYQSFSFSISPSNSYYWTPIEYLLRINWVPTLLLSPQKTKNKKQFLFSQNSESSGRNTCIHIGQLPTILRLMFLKTLWVGILWTKNLRI